MVISDDDIRRLIEGDLSVCLKCGEVTKVGTLHSCQTPPTSTLPETIVADSRERLSHPYSTEALPAGDYLITTASGMTILVERKSYSDLVKSFMDDRLQAQVWKMAGQADRCVLIVEKGYVPKKVRKLLKSTLKYTRSRLEPVIYVAYTEDYDDTLELLEKWRLKGDSIFTIHRPIGKADRSESLLNAFPGIGEVTRNKILASGRFKSFTDFVQRFDEAKDLLSKAVFNKIRTLLDEDWK